MNAPVEMRVEPTPQQKYCEVSGGHELSKLKRGEAHPDWPWRDCRRCGFRIWVGAGEQEQEEVVMTEHAGWRIWDIGDYIAFDNKPLIERAKATGDQGPVFEYAIVSKRLIRTANNAFIHG